MVGHQDRNRIHQGRFRLERLIIEYGFHPFNESVISNIIGPRGGEIQMHQLQHRFKVLDRT